MNIFKKIVVWILCFCLILSIVASTGAVLVFGADSDDFYDEEDYAYPTLEYPYYEFENIVGVLKSDDFILVTQELTKSTGTTYYEYVVFDEDGEFYHTFEMSSYIGDVQKVQIYENTAISLNYLSSDSSMFYSNQMVAAGNTSVGSYSAMLQEDVEYYITDFAVADDYIYYIKLGLSPSIKYRTLKDGYDVSTVSSEYSLSLDISNFTAIESCGDDIIIETSYSDLYHYDTSSKELTELTNIPSEDIIQFGGYNNNIFILTAEGVYYCDIDESDEFELLLATTDDASTDSNIVDPVAFSVTYESSLVKILIADNDGAMALKSFSISEGMLLSDMFSIYSFSSSEDGYNTPTSISSSYQSYVVCDSENNRVKVIDDDGDVKMYTTVDEDGDLITPIYAGIDYQENIYVISDKNDFYLYTSSGNLKYYYEKFEDSSLRSVSGLEVSPYDTTCYFLSGSNLMHFDASTGELTCPAEGLSTGNGISIDYLNNYVGIYDSNSMDVYSLATFEEVYSVSKLNYIGSLYDIEFDLAGNFYALASSDYYSVVSKYSMIGEDHDDYDEDEIEYERVAASIFNDDDNSNFVMFTINFEDEMAYFIREDEHRVYETDDLFDDLEVEYELDIEIPNDIFQQTETEEVQILNVASSGNRLLLPADKNDDYYPTGYAIIRPIKLAENSKVIIAGISEDEDIYYVIYNNSVGFMYIDALEESTEDVELPFEDALSLHDNTYIYKYPLSTTSGNIPLYGFAQLEKDTTLTVLDLANDYVCPMGMLWYRVEALVDGDTIVGYMPRYNVVENSSESDNTYEYGRINAKLFEGYAVVYADEGVTELGKKIYDGEKVEIMAERGDYYYVREVDPTGDTAVEGYVLKELVTTDTQTRSFTIAVILIFVLILAIGAIIIVKMRLKKKRII